MFKSKLFVMLLAAAVLLPAAEICAAQEPDPWVELAREEMQAGPAGQTAEKKDEKKDDKKPTLPLKAERKIEFTTDEATWLSLDVSSDGKWIVFELLGDLYTLSIAGGDAKRITDGMAYDSQPRISPDGKWIAFISDRDGNDNLWIVKADGTEPKQITKDNRIGFRSPTWTPDSQYVVATKLQQGANFWMYNVRGGSGINLTAPAPGAAPTPGQPSPARIGAAFSPDGKFLYFAQKAGGQSVYNQMNFGWQIARRDMDTGAVDIVTRADGSAIRPMISPDG